MYPTSSGAKVAVKNTSLGIPRGECFGLLGINGAGKSSTLAILSGALVYRIMVVQGAVLLLLLLAQDEEAISAQTHRKPTHDTTCTVKIRPLSVLTRAQTCLNPYSPFVQNAGELPPTTGSAFLGGFDVCKDPEEIHRLVGYCPQFDAQFETLTAREHLALYASIKVGYRLGCAAPRLATLVLQYHGGSLFHGEVRCYMVEVGCFILSLSPSSLL